MDIIRPALSLFAFFTVLTGVVYPLVVTGISQVVFPHQANGSLIRAGEKVVGSELIGQGFVDPAHFWSRPSATSPFPYNSALSVGSNYGPLNDELVKSAQARIDALRAADPGNEAPIPIDLVTASGSGLDPHISPAAAHWQAARVARAHGIDPRTVDLLVSQHTHRRQLGVLGEPAVDVLALNLALDARSQP